MSAASSAANSAVKFKVQDVEPKRSGKSAQPPTALKQAWEQQRKFKVEAMSPQPKNLVMSFTTENMLAKAVHTAFYSHCPLRLTPDVIWVTISQGLANHVDQNPEGLRHHFVQHKEGKEKISISRPGFIKGSPNNDWEGVFPEFAEKIGERIGKEKQKLVECDFTTSTPVSRIVSQITLMDTVKHYFEYEMMCGCGIPSIELTGTVDDWKSIRARVDNLRQFELDWWIDELAPVLDQFVNAAQGQADVKFWTSICNLYGASGTRSPVSGWIQAFFPYLNASGESEGRWGSLLSGRGGRGRGRGGRDDVENGGGDGGGASAASKPLVRNEYMGAWRKSVETNSQSDLERGFRRGEGCGYGVKLEVIPPGLSNAPFVYVDMAAPGGPGPGSGKSYDMCFSGGVVGVVEEADGTLEPVLGWAVLE